MPIYEYVCRDCGTRFERIVLHAKSKVSCPKCASGRHTLQPSVFAAQSSHGSGGPSPASGGGGCCGGDCGCH